MSISAGREPEPGSGWLFAGADEGLCELSDTELLDEAGRNERAAWVADCRRLCVAAAWAHRHGVVEPGVMLDGREVPGTERLVRLGGEGVPGVAEFALAELGAVLGLSPGSTRVLVADALDLRHRLPGCWDLVRDAAVPASYPRQVADRTRHLSRVAAAAVDRAIATMLGRSTQVRRGAVAKIAWSRFIGRLERVKFSV